MAIKLLPEEVPAVRKWLNDRSWDMICPWGSLYPGTRKVCNPWAYARCKRLFPLTKTNSTCPCVIYSTAYVVKRVRHWLKQAEQAEYEEKNHE